MKLHRAGRFVRLAKRLAGPLSTLVANPATAGVARLVEAYWSILLGKGAGSRWGVRAEVECAKSVIGSDRPVVFDVGANLGEWSARFAELFPEATILMFEPQPACHDAISLRDIPNAELITKAVSAESGVATIYTPEARSGLASLHRRRDSGVIDETFEAIEVETVTLDELIESRSIDHVDFVKIDIEGHELAALHGARRCLSQGTIKAFSFEFGSGNINSRTYFRDFWDLLDPLNYRIYRVLPSARLLPIREYYEDCEHFRGVTNYIAVLEPGR